METILNEAEVRVVGSLVEKQVTTPDYYPLTLNALVNACNQLSNRDPVVKYDERAVEYAIDSLRTRNLVYIFYGAESRVPKYKHMMREVYALSPQELAVMCVLMLRGPQTVGEIRGRTGRLYEFAELREVEETLDGLARRDEPLVLKLPRQTGRKDARYTHLLSGTPEFEEPGEETSAHAPARAPSPARAAEGERVARLESEVEALRGEVAELRRQLEEFRKQFE
ncbi:MAG TPA: YceH family protein [Pyrinomonadaceae bacterium]|nr:YceH family protein [Pyrinomonadaceae bacterium]